VAASLVNNPDVEFLDEPTTGLDPQARRSLWELVRSLNREEGKTVILTTHYLEEAETLADRVAIIDNGAFRP
jgi:ABC-2 type transport system ATP-binding protein